MIPSRSPALASRFATIVADVEDTPRSVTFMVESTSGQADQLLIPLAAGQGNDLGPIDNLALGTTAVAALAASAGVDIAIEVGVTTCTLTILVETAAG